MTDRPLTTEDRLQVVTIVHAAERLDCSTNHVRLLLDVGLLRGVKPIAPGASGVTKQSRRYVYLDSIASYLEIPDVKPKRQRRSADYLQRVNLARARRGFPPCDEHGRLAPEHTGAPYGGPCVPAA